MPARNGLVRVALPRVRVPSRARSVWRRWWLYRRHWNVVMTSAGLGLGDAMPRLGRVRAAGAGEVVRVRPRPYQSVESIRQQTTTFAPMFGWTNCSVVEVRRAWPVRLLRAVRYANPSDVELRFTNTTPEPKTRRAPADKSVSKPVKRVKPVQLALPLNDRPSTVDGGRSEVVQGIPVPVAKGAGAMATPGATAAFKAALNGSEVSEADALVSKWRSTTMELLEQVAALKRELAELPHDTGSNYAAECQRYVEFLMQWLMWLHTRVRRLSE